MLCDGASPENIASTVVDCTKIETGQIGFFRVGLIPKSKVIRLLWLTGEFFFCFSYCVLPFTSFSNFFYFWIFAGSPNFWGGSKETQTGANKSCFWVRSNYTKRAVRSIQERKTHEKEVDSLQFLQVYLSSWKLETKFENEKKFFQMFPLRKMQKSLSTLENQHIFRMPKQCLFFSLFFQLHLQI